MFAHTYVYTYNIAFGTSSECFISNINISVTIIIIIIIIINISSSSSSSIAITVIICVYELGNVPRPPHAEICVHIHI